MLSPAEMTKWQRHVGTQEPGKELVFKNKFITYLNPSTGQSFPRITECWLLGQQRSLGGLHTELVGFTITTLPGLILDTNTQTLVGQLPDLADPAMTFVLVETRFHF